MLKLSPTTIMDVNIKMIQYIPALVGLLISGKSLNTIKETMVKYSRAAKKE